MLSGHYLAGLREMSVRKAPQSMIDIVLLCNLMKRLRFRFSYVVLCAMVSKICRRIDYRERVPLPHRS